MTSIEFHGGRKGNGGDGMCAPLPRLSSDIRPRCDPLLPTPGQTFAYLNAATGRKKKKKREEERTFSIFGSRQRRSAARKVILAESTQWKTSKLNQQSIIVLVIIVDKIRIIAVKVNRCPVLGFLPFWRQISCNSLKR